MGPSADNRTFLRTFVAAVDHTRLPHRVVLAERISPAVDILVAVALGCLPGMDSRGAPYGAAVAVGNGLGVGSVGRCSVEELSAHLKREAPLLRSPVRLGSVL